METVILFIIILYFILFAFGFISYVFNSMGLYTIAENEGENHSFLAWIPYLSDFILGRIAFKSNIHAIVMTILNIVAVIAAICMLFINDSAIAIISFVIASFILSTISTIYKFIAHYKVYEKYSGSTIIMMIFDVLSCGILGPIFIFAIRNNELKEN